MIDKAFWKTPCLSRRLEIEVLEDRLLLTGASFAALDLPRLAPVNDNSAIHSPAIPTTQTGLSNLQRGQPTGTGQPLYDGRGALVLDIIHAVPDSVLNAGATQSDARREAFDLYRSELSAAFAISGMDHTRDEDALVGPIQDCVHHALDSDKLLPFLAALPKSTGVVTGQSPATEPDSDITEAPIDLTKGQVAHEKADPNLVEPAAGQTADDKTPDGQLPETLASLDSVVPFDWVQLRQDVSAFFARLSHPVGNADASNPTDIADVVPWLLAGGALAFELAYHRKRQESERLARVDDVALRLDFFAEGEAR